MVCHGYPFSFHCLLCRNVGRNLCLPLTPSCKRRRSVARTGTLQQSEADY